MMAPERLRELGGLAVADAVRDLADGQPAARQELARALHAHGGEVLAERRVPDLRVGALQLPARGGDAPRDVVERQVAPYSVSTIAVASSKSAVRCLMVAGLWVGICLWYVSPASGR